MLTPGTRVEFGDSGGGIVLERGSGLIPPEHRDTRSDDATYSYVKYYEPVVTGSLDFDEWMNGVEEETTGGWFKDTALRVVAAARPYGPGEYHRREEGERVIWTDPSGADVPGTVTGTVWPTAHKQGGWSLLLDDGRECVTAPERCRPE